MLPLGGQDPVPPPFSWGIPGMGSNHREAPEGKGVGSRRPEEACKGPGLMHGWQGRGRSLSVALALGFRGGRGRALG